MKVRSVVGALAIVFFSAPLFAADILLSSLDPLEECQSRLSARMMSFETATKVDVRVSKEVWESLEQCETASPIIFERLYLLTKILNNSTSRRDIEIGSKIVRMNFKVDYLPLADCLSASDDPTKYDVKVTLFRWPMGSAYSNASSLDAAFAKTPEEYAAEDASKKITIANRLP